MTKKQIIIIAALVIFVFVVVIAGFLTKRFVPNQPNSSMPSVVQKIFKSNATGTNQIYSSQIPAGATLSNPVNAAPASSNPDLTSQIKTFNLQATASGFDPSSITVNQGDSLKINFTSVGADYDLNIPYLGVYFPVVKRGQTRILPFDTSAPGTFVFECRDYCPSSGKIQGALIILPKK